MLAEDEQLLAEKLAGHLEALWPALHIVARAGSAGWWRARSPVAAMSSSSPMAVLLDDGERLVALPHVRSRTACHVGQVDRRVFADRCDCRFEGANVLRRMISCDCGAALSGRRDALKWLAGLGVAADAALAQGASKVEPRSYWVLFENDKVRVLEYLSRAGLSVCGSGRHSHPDHVTVTLTPAR